MPARSGERAGVARALRMRSQPSVIPRTQSSALQTETGGDPAQARGATAARELAPLSRLPARIAIALLVLCSAAPARAVQVYYTVENLSGNRWLYVYELDRFPYATGCGFTVHFDPELYEDLSTAQPAPGSDWEPAVVQPDAGLGADGLYDVEALYDDSTSAAVFRVSFDWLGVGTPGDQPFEVREPFPSFATVESGTTLAPEPAALAQHAGTLLALAALLAARGRSRC